MEPESSLTVPEMEKAWAEIPNPRRIRLVNTKMDSRLARTFFILTFLLPPTHAVAKDDKGVREPHKPHNWGWMQVKHGDL